MTTFEKEFIDQCILRIKENPPRIKKCLALLSEEEFWRRPNPSSNSVGNLLLHLSGNIRQYAVSALGNILDERVRDIEFETEGGFSKEDLWKKLNSVIILAISTIKSTNNVGWLQKRKVQGFEFSGIGILIHVVEHLSYHTGQIAFYTKELKDKQVEFYARIDLNAKNEND